jgi:Flp pilus assembly protein TadB
MDFLSGLSAGWAAFVGFFSGLLVAFGVLLPWLIAAAVISAVIVLIVRRNRRRKAQPAD